MKSEREKSQSTENLITTVVVATRNRTLMLTKLLDKLESQIVKPDYVVVIDSSDTFEQIRGDGYSFSLVHEFSKERSTATQRNRALEIVNPETEFLVFLDDDTHPDEWYIKKGIESLQNNKLIGCSGIAVSWENQKNRKEISNLMKRIFFLHSSKQGILTRGLINVPVSKFGPLLCDSEWLIACAFYDYKTVKHLRFEYDFQGYALGEDVIYSYRASLLGRIAVNREILLPHFEVSRLDHYGPDYWKKWVVYRNRLAEIAGLTQIEKMSVFWTNLGQILVIILSRSSKPISSIRSVKNILRETKF